MKCLWCKNESVVGKRKCQSCLDKACKNSKKYSLKHKEKRKQYNKEYGIKNKNKISINKKQYAIDHKKEKIQYRRSHNLEYKLFCLSICGEECKCCGYNKCHASLDFHHIGASKKHKNISTMENSSREDVLKELSKCMTICSNCHHVEESNLRKKKGFSKTKRNINRRTNKYNRKTFFIKLKMRRYFD